METLEDFEMNFYNGGKIIKPTGKDVKVFDCNEQSVAKETVPDMWNHYLECFQRCVNIERTVKEMQTDSDHFPVIIGRRPASASKLNTVKEYNSPNALTPKPSNVRYHHYFFFFSNYGFIDMLPVCKIRRLQKC